jgi:hypothetical protein
MATCNRPGCKNKAARRGGICGKCEKALEAEVFDRSTRTGFRAYMERHPACLEEGFGPGVTVDEAISELEAIGVDLPVSA